MLEEAMLGAASLGFPCPFCNLTPFPSRSGELKRKRKKTKQRGERRQLA
jgi:hypothetical protein